MKKFLHEYKAFRSITESETSKRERLTVTTRRVSPEPPNPEEQCVENSAQIDHSQIGTIRTEEYKRDLAEFQARRSTGSKDLQITPEKKKCGRHSLPVSCTDCSADHDNTFNYEKKSAVKYKKKSRRARSTMSDEKMYDNGVPNIQFLFQNQVFMPGNMLATSTYSEPSRYKRQNRQRCYNRPSDIDFLTQRHIDFKDDDQTASPEFLKKSSLPFDVKNFLEGRRCEEEVDGVKHMSDVKLSSQNSSNGFSKNDSGEEKLWEVMSELKSFDRWADEQLLQTRSPASKSEDTKSDTSAHGLPIASASNIDVTADRSKVWSHGKWGVVPVQIKRLPGVTIDHVKKKKNREINILRKCRHPNIIIMMGLYPDLHDGVNIVCERCADSLYGILHVQGRILTVQTSVQYALDIANALVFLRMQGYIHTGLNSEGIMVTSRDAAKLADLSTCQRLPRSTSLPDKGYELYSPEPQYVNIEDSRQSIKTIENEPLLSNRSSEAYLQANAVSIDYEALRKSPHYRWQAPELFAPDEQGFVYACSKSDVYSLALILWECCNASLPWKSLSYEKLKECYVLWRTGMQLPADGTYPGGLLDLLQQALRLRRDRRATLAALHQAMQALKCDVDEMEYIVIPARLSKKKSQFSSPWETTSPTDSECLSPQRELRHEAVVHNEASSAESEKECSKSDASPLYEVIDKSPPDATYAIPDKSFVSDEDTVDRRPLLKYSHLPEREFSSACSTPIAKIKARIKDIGTPGALHRSDSTEYCSILSPNRTNHLNDDTAKDQNNLERPTAKLSRSFTPKSYKPLHIKVPQCNLESVKSILKEQNDPAPSSYNFDIKNYSLPTTPIARSNKLRKNAWLSGDLSFAKRSTEVLQDLKTSNKYDSESASVSPNTPATSTNACLEKGSHGDSSCYQCQEKETSPDTIISQSSYSALGRVNTQSFSSPDADVPQRERSNSWSFKTSAERYDTKHKVEDEILAGVNVKPLVAIHERWIYEANKKTGRSMSLPEGNKCGPAVKPALLRASQLSYVGEQWEQFCQARDAVARGVNFGREHDRLPVRRKEQHKSIETETPSVALKVDQATETKSIEEFIKELIRKEFTQLIHELSDDGSVHRSEEILNKGVTNIVGSLRCEDEEDPKKEIRSFSRVKINGNNKPLLQITFSRSGENSLQVLDGCVSVTVSGRTTCESVPAPASASSAAAQPASASADDAHTNSLKRCQAFSALQEARSTEDLYIDDDLSTHMQENFGGRVKLIPLHGSLHEILCEKEDECCLIKVKQENGCDTIYFRCDSSDTESRDALDGCHDAQDTVVYKRSISLVEERIQRIFPKDKTPQTPVTVRTSRPKETLKVRPKSEVFVQNITKDTRMLSNSSPSLTMKDDRSDEVEVNIENVMCYQDSSSEECIKCQADNDDFELLEKKIEEDLANNTLSSITCGCLEKISEENLSILNEEMTDKE